MKTVYEAAKILRDLSDELKNLHVKLTEQPINSNMSIQDAINAVRSANGGKHCMIEVKFSVYESNDQKVEFCCYDSGAKRGESFSEAPTLGELIRKVVGKYARDESETTPEAAENLILSAAGIEF